MEIHVNPNSTPTPAVMLDSVLNNSIFSSDFVSKEQLFELIERLLTSFINSSGLTLESFRNKVYEFLDFEVNKNELLTILAAYRQFYYSVMNEYPYDVHDRRVIQILTESLSKTGRLTNLNRFYDWLNIAVQGNKEQDKVEPEEVYNKEEISEFIRQKMEERTALKQKLDEVRPEYRNLTNEKLTEVPANHQVNIGDLLRLKVTELLMDDKISYGKAAILLSMLH